MITEYVSVNASNLPTDGTYGRYFLLFGQNQMFYIVLNYQFKTKHYGKSTVVTQPS
jgi:hypothetical protein